MKNNVFTFSEENYLKSIYHLAGGSNQEVSTNAIAKKLITKSSSVTDMVKKLSKKKVLNYKKYQGVTLTTLGRKTAINIIRKHRLWEVFLVEKLNFSWYEVHEVAEQLEHIKSKKLIDELDAFLNFPKQDPHGDPIPNKYGTLQEIEKKLLSTFNKGEKGICVGVNDSCSEFLRLLDKQKISLGAEIEVIEKEPFDGSFIIKIKNQKIAISQKIATNLYVQKK